MRYLKNAWYVGAIHYEVEHGALFHRKMFDTNVLIYRKRDGVPVAMRDRCPHRFAPLHMGRQEGDDVVCHYHGLRFDCSGSCVHNPHGDGAIPRRAVVPIYPTVERYGLIWIWMGDPAQADPALIPPYEAIEDGPDTGVAYGYLQMDCNYELVADNVMDLSHVDHIHGPLIYTGGKLTPLKPNVEDIDESVRTTWHWVQQPAMGLFADFLPDPEAPARHFAQVTWRAPCNMVVNVGATQSENGYDDALQVIDHHIMTPESKYKTHYFMVARRNYNVDDAEYNRVKMEGMLDAFRNEDAPVVAAIQAEMGEADLESLRPVYLAGDPGPIRCRRRLRELIDAEEAAEHGETATRAVG